MAIPTLTTSLDTFVGNAGNDTITATTATLVAGDTIIDQSSTDNDTLNLTLTATNPLAKVAGIENINVNWDAFADAGFAAANVSGATIN